MKEDQEPFIEDPKKAGLEEALQLWNEMRQVDKVNGWKRLTADLSGMRSVRSRKISLKYIRSIAAVIMLLLTIGGVGVLWLWPENDTSVVNENPISVVVDCGQPRLILGNGQQIALGNGTDAEEDMVEKSNFVINLKEKSVVYTMNDTAPSGVLEYNTIEIPRGAEYKLILADGTHVWLNAETRLRYPVNFGQQERRVYLEGEAYFQVNRDAARPFRVESSAQTVEVLGTQFNVYAYSKEPQMYTTLVEGSVVVSSSLSGEQLKLSPGEQGVVGVCQGDISVSKVDVNQVVGWKNGMFVFDDQNLETILRKVERWYNVQVFFKNNAAKSLVFKGNLPRYGELSELLKVLESGSQVRFSLKDRSLVVE